MAPPVLAQDTPAFYPTDQPLPPVDGHTTFEARLSPPASIGQVAQETVLFYDPGAPALVSANLGGDWTVSLQGAAGAACGELFLGRIDAGENLFTPVHEEFILPGVHTFHVASLNLPEGSYLAFRFHDLCGGGLSTGPDTWVAPPEGNGGVFPVPELGTLVLVSVGLVGLALTAGRRPKEL